MKTILGIITLLLTCAIGLWKSSQRKKKYKREMAAKAKEKLDHANSEDGTASDMLDAFSRMPR